MSGHTKGPWVATRLGGGKGGPNPYRIAIDPDDMSSLAAIAKVYGKPSGVAKANARLIASAPDLLEALENLLSQCAPVPDSESNLGREWNKAIEEASLALAKARGET